MHQGNGEDEVEPSKLFEFLREEFPGKDFADKAPNWRLEEDLGLYGDEAEDFLTRFAERFGVDMKGFDIDRHFRPEIDPISNFFRTLLFARKEPEASLTIGDLKRAVRSKRLT